MANRAKAKGTSWESAIVNHLAARGIESRRKALAGGQDEGDIDVGPSGPGRGWTLEAKNVRTYAFGAWVEEAALEAKHAGRPCAVVAKRNGKGSPGEGFVVMRFDDFIDWVLTNDLPDSV